MPSRTLTTDDTDDELLAGLLVRMWTLASGRSLPRDVPAAELSAEELMTFWADDMNPPSGRHTATDVPPGPVVPIGGLPDARSSAVGQAA